MVTAPQIRYNPSPRFHADGIPVYFGSSRDSRVLYDAANDEWTVQTKDASGTFQDRVRVEANTNTPDVDLAGNPVKWTSGRAVTSGDYAVGRDADGTNQLHFNVPTGASFEWSINDAAVFVLSSNGDATVGDNSDNVVTWQFDRNASSAGTTLANLRGRWNGMNVAEVWLLSGSDTTNKDEGRIAFATAAPGGTITNRMLLDENGGVFINDIANADMSTGLTINQGANDDEILALKSSDVAHGMTAQAETDTFAHFKKLNANEGGLLLEAYRGGTGDTGLYLAGFAPTDTTTKLTSSSGYISLNAVKKSGTTGQSPGADANLAVIRDGWAGTTRFIFDLEGSAHADIEWVAFDAEDDITALRDLEAVMLPDRFGQSLVYHREDFERMKIVGRGSWYEENGRTRAMVNFTRLAMLHHGAIQQVYDQVRSITRRLKAAGVLPEA